MVDLDYLKMSKPQKFAHNCSRFFASLPGRIGGLFKGLGLWIVGLFKGLGLSIARRLAEGMGGHLVCMARAGGGAEFRLYFGGDTK